jgi:hypothetical protein
MRSSHLRLLPLATFLAACGTFTAHTPPGFVALDETQHYDYRATTHDGVVVSVRALDNDPRGDEGFWSDAVAQRLRQQGGYALVESHPVTTATGLAGRQLTFGHDEGVRPHLYRVTLFVTRKRIYLLEAGAARDPMKREASRLDAFVAAFEPRRCWFGACVAVPTPPR